MRFNRLENYLFRRGCRELPGARLPGGAIANTRIQLISLEPERVRFTTLAGKILLHPYNSSRLLGTGNTLHFGLHLARIARERRWLWERGHSAIWAHSRRHPHHLQKCSSASLHQKHVLEA
ncbi:hypothetical protein BaRGS_00029326 [Batillaria attramentaria]|uniref:Uncharacterized protein n=1 Tax=Batillaria attramentaria TaxID=370345 RepID=A0ABD0JXC1_9CAEN